MYAAIFCCFPLFSSKLPDPAKKMRKNFSIFSICATVLSDLFCRLWQFQNLPKLPHRRKMMSGTV